MAARASAPIVVRSYGAALTVTGSCHLVEGGGARVLVDCGAFQGSHALFDLNRGPFGFDPASIDAVLLTHAHLDHCGRLPKLVREGFAGRVHARPATRMLAEHLLLDAAKLQEEDAARDRRHGKEPRRPIYTDDDVRETLTRFDPLGYGTATEVAGLGVTAQPAGHIPGSASFLVESRGFRLAASGDIGNARKDVLPDPTPCPPADLVLIESTYGDRDHRGFAETLDELASILREAERRSGKILIPSFALERTQDVLYHVARLEDEGEITPIPVYVDSPLAGKVEDVYAACAEELSDEVHAIAESGRDPFSPRRLAYTRSVDESKAINRSKEPAIVIAGSGMLSGGRILHHLKAHLGDSHTTVVIVGFQPRGGLGRLLVDGARHVRIMGEEVAVRARVATVGGLSAHADRTELLHWASGAGQGAEFRCVHGEPSSIEALAAGLRAAGNEARAQESEIRLPDHGRPDEGGE